MGKEPTFEDAVNTFINLEEIEDRLAITTGSTSELLEEAIASTGSRLETMVQQPAISTRLSEIRAEYDMDVQNIQWLRDRGMISQAEAEEWDEKIDQGLKSPEVRLAGRFALADSVEVTPQETPSQESAGPKKETPKERTDRFLGRDVSTVAESLLGKKITARGKTAEITEVLPQDKDYNEKWLEKDPIFGDDRVDAMVSTTQSHKILYIRAGDESNPNECVRITEVVMDGEEHKGAAKVAKALGFDKNCTGSVLVSNKGIRIVGITE